jgi:hypothetical protein
VEASAFRKGRDSPVLFLRTNGEERGCEKRMALLTDGSPNDTESLRVYETAILNVAHVEMIDLEAKLALATEESSFEVLDVLLGHTESTARRRLGVSDVVVTPQLKRWHALHALALIYRDAFNNQLNDRYQAKWDEYRELARQAKEQAVRFGIGLVTSPIPKANTPLLSSTAGTLPAAIYYVRTSWISAVGQEGTPSDVTTYETVDGSYLAIGAGDAPGGVTAWNVFIGVTDSAITRQNGVPLAVGQTFSVPSTGLVAGMVPGTGQAADMYVTGGRLLGRG